MNSQLVVQGFKASGIHCGIKEEGRKDLALIYSEVPALATGVFTTNAFKAAPVLVDMMRIKSGKAQAIIINSGNANAATGAEGYADALSVSRALADRLKIREEMVLVASTGVIGRRLPTAKIMGGIGRLVDALNPDGIAFAEEGIMTTDKFPKIAYGRTDIGGTTVSLCGIAKGAGMIEPNMATMLAFFMTDADMEPMALNGVFRFAVDRGFNAISVDGCMSTNDTAILLANGRAGNSPIRKGSKAFGAFSGLLESVVTDLSKAMVKDGEGATKVIEIHVEGAKTLRDAKAVARAIANSNLVKTAFYGGDPNWGRIIGAVGSVGIAVPVERVELSFQDRIIFAGGQGVSQDLKVLADIMKRPEIMLRIDLAMGTKAWRMFASDLTHEYVDINAHYTT